MAKVRSVNIGEVIISEDAGDVLSAPNLGSCLGVTIYDTEERIGALIHCFLPLSKSNPEKAAANPTTFVDSGVVWTLQELMKRGASKDNLVICVGGGGMINDKNGVFQIGKKNYTVFRKVLWKNGLLIKNEEVGGEVSRTVSLNIETGEVSVKSNRQETRLY